ncbi:hypothetical protein BU26DRAFT_571821 [Trematosphaeria pertusa]|uniref:Uncharacterized protein n=1 Tax=Trematosphaeria pertusa TaxID=390896 RepID=A0A6A6HU79_9PLEO|nr:uncharacterized protein BU26DRAFT_571821 [Trematosphaeria pertusa]KAF2241318.1 hypothetical protein BU26DRAFT_571821 [Trematosphaeria pertusa]
MASTSQYFAIPRDPTSPEIDNFLASRMDRRDEKRISYSLNDTSVWHIFYVSEDNVVKQKQNSNSTNIWQDGPLTELNLTAYDAPNVGLLACWYGNYYGDSDASKFPTRDGNNNTIPFNSSAPVARWCS